MAVFASSPQESLTLYPARFWEREEDRVVCTLCPRTCRIPEGEHGFCYIRQVREGKLYTIGFGRPTGIALDPVEKKPLNHFLPGSSVLSFGTAGCNLGCKFCQNWGISKARLDERNSLSLPPERVVELALESGASGIAYTYNDPVIFAEYVIEISKIARSRGVKNILVTAGYVTPTAREELYAFADAANVDLKGFTEEFYLKVCGSGHLEPVLDTLKWIRHSTRVWLEITTLLIPGLNDSEDEIRREVRWIAENLGLDIPLHFTAFHPDYRLLDRPPTPPETVKRARRIAMSEGLLFVYTGNIRDPEGQTTYCPHCRKPLIVRDGFSILQYQLTPEGTCKFCDTPIPGTFPSTPVFPTLSRPIPILYPRGN
jgi:pyruvate formate lyase activating enzyme